MFAIITAENFVFEAYGCECGYCKWIFMGFRMDYCTKYQIGVFFSNEIFTMFSVSQENILIRELMSENFLKILI